LAPDDPADHLNSHHRGLSLPEDTIWKYAHCPRPDDRFKALLLHLILLIFHPAFVALDDGVDDIAGEDRYIRLLYLVQGIGQYIHIESQDGGKKGIVDGSDPY